MKVMMLARKRERGFNAFCRFVDVHFLNVKHCMCCSVLVERVRERARVNRVEGFPGSVV